MLITSSFSFIPKDLRVRPPPLPDFYEIEITYYQGESQAFFLFFLSRKYAACDH